jgi:phospholipase C
VCAALLTPFAIASCAGNPGGGATSGAIRGGLVPASHRGNAGAITHVIVMVQENRSFDNLFATFPGADGATTGRLGHKRIALQMHDLRELCDFGHSYQGFIRDYDGGKMNGFNQEGGGGRCPGKAGTAPYQYVNPTQIGPYWDIADQYVLGDHMFQTQGSGSFTAHQDLIRGATTIDGNQSVSLVDYPSRQPWGCDAAQGTVTSLLVWTGSILKDEYHKGPYPCTDHFPSSGSYQTLRDLLDAKSVSWRYYSPPVKGGGSGGLWNAFDMIAAVRKGPEWTDGHISSPETNIFNDISNHQLPAVSWLIPDEVDSDHPGSNSDKGPSWVASVVNAIGTSTYWSSTAIVIVWDDWGGFYDHAPPPFFDNWGGLGFRVPMLVVSTYARQGGSSQGGLISHTQYEFGSILRFIEDNWGLGTLGTTDVRATSIVDCFDFTQQPRKFRQIPSSYSSEYFKHRPPSYKPVDTE